MALEPTAIVLTQSGEARDSWYQPGPERGLSSYTELLDAARQAADGAALGRVILVGFSRGCQAIRTYAIEGYLADGNVLCDGVMGPIPLGGSNFDAWRRLFDNAKGGGPPVAASHSCIQTAPVASSTHTTLSALAGVNLPCSDTTGASVEYVDGNLTILSGGGGDAAAHIWQANNALPALLQRVLSQAVPGTGASYAGGTRSVLRWLAMGVGLVGGVIGARALMDD